MAPDFIGDDPATMTIGTCSVCQLCDGTGVYPRLTPRRDPGDEIPRAGAVRKARNAESVTEADDEGEVLSLMKAELARLEAAWGILKFQRPQQETEFRRAVHATDWWLVVWDILQELRDIEKYGREGYDGETAAKLREWLYGELAERGLQLED